MSFATKIRSALSVLPAAAALVGLLSACAPSAEEIQAEFEAEVASSRACEQASDCVTMSPGCPLGCWVVVNQASRAELERKARELIDEYESGGSACAYECTEAPSVACSAGLCSPAD